MSEHAGQPRDISDDDPRAMREALARYKLLTDYAVDSLLLVGTDANIAYANRAACELHGYADGELTGLPATAVSPTATPDRIDYYFAYTREKDIPLIEVPHRRKDGSIFPAEANVRYVEIAGTPYLFTASRDVTERKLIERSAAQLAAIVETTEDAVVSKALDGTIQTWNAAAERLFGHAAGEAVGRSIAMLFPPDRLEEEPKIIARIRQGQRVEHFETVRLHKDGRLLDVSVTISPIRDRSGKIIGASKIARDISARKLVEAERRRFAAELENERAKLAEIIRQAPAFICILRGPEHRFEIANERYYDLIGPREVIGRAVREALPEIAGQGFFELLDEVYASGKVFHASERPALVRPRGDGPLERHFLDFVYQPLRDAGGAVSGVFVHGIDVTDQVLARDAIRVSEAKFRELADAMPQIVFAAQPDGTVDYYNRRWYEYTGLPPGTTGDVGWDRILPVEDIAHVLDVWNESLRTGNPYEIEYRLRRGADDAFRWHLGRALPIRDAGGAIVRWFGTNTDVHDYKLLQQQNAALLESERAARGEAERQGRMKDEFLATLSHELRTPLNAILGWSQILRAGAGDPQDVAEGLEVIDRNARAQTQIIEDILDMSRIVSGKLRLDVQRLDLAGIVRAGVNTVQPAADAKGVKLRAVLDPLAAPISGDGNRLHQVFWNLLSNAVKFTPRGGQVQVLLERVNSHVEVSVIDTGEGITPEFLPHVFDRFRQADASTTRRHGGLGLGLSIVKQLVELHGGSVRAKSPGPGRGSTFIVSLPVTVVHPEPAEPGAPREHPSSEPVDRPHDDACASLEGVDVLVVDDEADARGVVKRLLEDCGATVRTAGSVDEALEAFKAKVPHLLLSDIGMPGQDGYALIRKIRALPLEQGGGVNALALTAYARATDRVRVMEAGFQMHLAKPVDSRELIVTVATLTKMSVTKPSV